MFMENCLCRKVLEHFYESQCLEKERLPLDTYFCFLFDEFIHLKNPLYIGISLSFFRTKNLTYKK